MNAYKCTSIIECIKQDGLTFKLMETPLKAFENRTDTYQAALFSLGNMIRYEPTLVNLTSKVCVLCSNVKVYLLNYS